jgi:hypothetical protein
VFIAIVRVAEVARLAGLAMIRPDAGRVHAESDQRRGCSAAHFAARAFRVLAWLRRSRHCDIVAPTLESLLLEPPYGAAVAGCPMISS